MAVLPAANESAGIKTGSMEYIKQHLVYDVSNRLIEVYEARANAVDGAYALKTTYAYDNTSLRVVSMKEESSTWTASWDI